MLSGEFSGSEHSHFPGEPLPEGEEVRVWEVLAVWLTEGECLRGRGD